MTIDTKTLKALRRYHEAALSEPEPTPLPWKSAAMRQPWADDASNPHAIVDGSGNRVFSQNWKAVCAQVGVVVAARNALPVLLDEIERLKQNQQRLTAALRAALPEPLRKARNALEALQQYESAETTEAFTLIAEIEKEQ